MRQHTEICLRRLLPQFQGRFSPEFDRFFTDLQEKYKAVGYPSTIPEHVMPIWVKIAQMEGIPMEAKPKLPTPPPEPVPIPQGRVDYRTREGRALKEQQELAAAGA